MPKLLDVLRTNDRITPRRLTYAALNQERVAELLARDVQRGAKSIALQLLCVGSEPTRPGIPSTTITDPDDASQVVAGNAT
jgi:hypothetical protein